MVVDRDDRLPEEANKLNLLAKIYCNAGCRSWAQIAAEERANASNASSAGRAPDPVSDKCHPHSSTPHLNPSAGNIPITSRQSPACQWQDQERGDPAHCDDAQLKLCSFVRLYTYTNSPHGRPPNTGYHAFHVFVLFPITVNPWMSFWKSVRERAFSWC